MGQTQLRDAQEIDVILDCSCGTSFYVHLPDVPYECPTCHSIYEVGLQIRHVLKTSDNFKIIGTKL